MLFPVETTLGAAILATDVTLGAISLLVASTIFGAVATAVFPTATADIG